MENVKIKNIIYSTKDILILLFIGYIVYMEWEADAKQYFILWIFLAIAAGILLIYKVLQREISIKIYINVIFVILAISTVLNISIFIKTSYTPLRDEHTNWDIDRIYEYFLPEESKEIEIIYTGLFSETVLNRILESKQVIIQKELENDVRISGALVGISFEYASLAGIEKTAVSEYIEHYDPQKLIYKDENENQILYLVTGTVWNEESANIYILLDEDSNVWLIPERLLGTEYRKAEKFKYQYEGSLEHIESIAYDYHMDPTMKLLLSEKDLISSNGAKSMLYFLFIWIAGLLGLLPVWNRLPASVICFLGLPFGSILVIVGIFSSGVILGMPIHLATFIFSVLILIVGIWSVYLHHGGRVYLNRKVSFTALAAVGSILCCVIYLSVYHRVYLSYDSLANLIVAEQAVDMGELRSGFARIANYSLLMPLMQIGASLFGISIFSLFVPMLCCVSLGVIWLLLWKIIPAADKVQKCIYFMCIFGAVVSIPVFQLNMFWLLNNLGIGMYYAIAISLIIYGNTVKKESYCYLAIPFFVIANTVRIEAPVFGAVFLIISADYLSEKLRKSYTISMICSAVIMFAVHVFIGEGATNIFWSYSKGAAELAVVFGASAYVFWIKESNIYKKVNKRIETGSLLEIAILLSILALGILKPVFLQQNIQGMCTSLFSGGINGMIWGIYLLSLTVKDENREIILIRNIINTYFLITFDLMMCRITPAHTNYTDSACRMMLHVTPLLIVYFILLLKKWTEKDVRKPEGKGEFL